MPSKRINLLLGLLAGLLCLIFRPVLMAQDIGVNSRWLNGPWEARWISCPGVPARAYGVYHFRKTFSLAQIPRHFIIHVSADNRYLLFVNGRQVGRGPARGDLYNWNFESYDIASDLQAGTNSLAALVWNMGEYAPVAQISNQTGFLLQGDGTAEQGVYTGRGWKVLDDSAYTPCALHMGRRLHTYMVVGPGDRLKARAYPWGWQGTFYDDRSWQRARLLNTPAVPVGYGSDNLWTLCPSPIPPMESRMLRLKFIRRSQGAFLSDTFIQAGHPLTIAPHRVLHILLDQGFETVAYPVLNLSGGQGSRIRLIYAEALEDPKGQKGNRNDIQGKNIRGIYDIFYPDGGKGRTFSPLWFRTYRYLQLNIRTGNQALVLNDLYGLRTGYPFHQLARFASNDSSLQQLWKVGWRTARNCAAETYFDCPYYEELQYEADTRIQALISLYNTGDDRLMKKAIHDFFDSRVPDGLTQGRYPSSRLQVIPPFSLFWISMMHDYWMLRPDPGFLKNYLDAAAAIIHWYARHVDTSRNMLGPMNWWNFTDWNNAFPNGVPNGATRGNSSVLSCQFIYTLHQAADLFAYFGRKREASGFLALAGRLSRGTYAQCFDRRRMEMANTPEKNSYSQHASVFAILAGVIPAAEQKQVMTRVLQDSTLSQATFYFRFYLTRALVKSGLGSRYYSLLKPWRDMLKLGLSTFAEKPEPTRSDCHGWSASPEFDFLATLCGIRPGSPGFRSLSIHPHLGSLTHIRAAMPHPQGLIRVAYRRLGPGGLKARIFLPGQLIGRFSWHGRIRLLHPGLQEFTLNR